MHPAGEIEVLLDSAIAVGQKTGLAAPYYLARAQFFDRKGEYRKALPDYNQYDSLTHTVRPHLLLCPLQVRDEVAYVATGAA